MVDRPVPEVELLKAYFPLKSIQNVVDLFRDQLENGDPNLAALSLATGYVEERLTSCKFARSNSTSLGLGLSLESTHEAFPCLEWEVFKNMLITYYTRIDDNIGFLRNNVDEAVDIDNHSVFYANFENQPSEREKVKVISDFVWKHLSTSYFKDRPHLQSVYSFLHGKRLDCFGVAFVVVTVAQYLGIENVHLALSEDHAWIRFGERAEETAEVTWHGRRDEAKRGNPVSQDSRVDFIKDWLYLAGHDVRCDRTMEVAALVSGLNPGIDSKTDSEIVGQLQQKLLWLLFEKDYLSRYPMAICNLADLEEIQPSSLSVCIYELYIEAIKISETIYSGFHVYPYTYYGGYLFRKAEYSEATKLWSKASRAASRYTHSSEDEELYKELHEIANTFFPEIIKRCNSKKTNHDYFECEENFTNILNFYDGVCLWEEDGCTSAIHSEWAKNFTKLISSFSFETRKKCIHQNQTAVLSVETDSTENSFPSSQKMKLLLDVVAKEKVNSQAVNLHLTSQVGLRSVASSRTKRAPEQTELSNKRKRP